MKTRLEQLARPVIGLALFGGFVLAFSGWAGVYCYALGWAIARTFKGG